MILKTTLQANEQREVAVRGDFIVCVSAKQGTKEVELIFSFDDTKEVELKQGATYKADDIFKRFLIKNPYPDAEVEINVIVVLKGQITYPANIEAAIQDSGLATETTLEKVETKIATEKTLKAGQIIKYSGVDVPYLYGVCATLGSTLTQEQDHEGFLKDIVTQGGPVNASYLSNIVQNQTLMLGELLTLKTLLTNAATIQNKNKGTYTKGGQQIKLINATGFQTITISEPNIKRLVFSVIIYPSNTVAAGEVFECDFILTAGDSDNNPTHTVVKTFKQSHAITEGVVNGTSQDYSIIQSGADAWNDILFTLNTRQINVPANKFMAIAINYKIYK